MKIKIVAWIIVGLIAITAFMAFAAQVTTEYVKEKTDIPETKEPEPVSVMYIHNPNVEYKVEPQVVYVTTIKAPEDAAETEPPVPEWSPDPNDAAMIAQVIWAEARGLSDTEKAAVAWCILNRVDAPGYGSTVREVVTAPFQFAFSWDTPILPNLYKLAEDVMIRWNAEREGQTDVGRVLPAEYCYFWGDGKHNYFRTTNTEQIYWDWSLPSPYVKENEK